MGTSYINLSTTTGETVSDGLFGGILINIKPTVRDGGDTAHIDHFTTVFDELDLGHIRFPDGEMPDGFVVDGKFMHNGMNGGSRVC